MSKRSGSLGAMSVAFMGVVAIAGTFLGLVPVLASHTDPKPTTTTALYIDVVNQTTLYNLGCNAGDRVDSGADPKSGEVILAYGSPVQINSTTYGAGLFSQPSAGTTQIRTATQQYAQGWYDCLSAANKSDSTVLLKVAIGVTNEYPSGWSNTTVSNHGNAWAQMVDGANGWRTPALAAKLAFRGGADIELGWSSPVKARAWVDGYNAHSSSWFYANFGGAAGCQWFSNGDEFSCGTTGQPSWTSADVYYISEEVPTAIPLPQIYRTDGISAEQWVLISQWGVDHGKPKLFFDGPLSQNGACGQVGGCSGTNNTATQAWNQMVNKMDARPQTVWDMKFSVDIKWLNP